MPIEKTREQRLKDIRMSLINGGLETSIRKIILNYIDVEYKEAFENASEQVLEIFVTVCWQLASANSRHTRLLNELVSIGVEGHEHAENWVQLNQIHRSLPDKIISAVKNENQGIKDTIEKSAKIEKVFTALPLTDKEKLMEGKYE